MMKYQYRLIARVVVEAATPLAIGTGQKDIHTDALVARDVNGLPFIPATSIAGVVRHMLEDGGMRLDDFFGCRRNRSAKGSEIIFSDGKMIGADGVAVDGLQTIDFQHPFYAHFRQMPLRQHVRMGHRGAAERHGKFDEEVVFKGTRFTFEIEAVSDSSDNELFAAVLRALRAAEFRLGSGSRKGFGKVVVRSCRSRVLDLADGDCLAWYLAHDSSLSHPFEGSDDGAEATTNATIYRLTLQPDDFFLFGAGFGDEEADFVPVRERQVKWKDEEGVAKPQLVDCQLIPASSVKGALAHRVAYHYNKRHEQWADCATAADIERFTTGNPAVVALFGSADSKNPKRGIVLFEDVLLSVLPTKVLNHVLIDRFTGGAVDGALFQEKASYGKGASFALTLTLTAPIGQDDVREVFEQALTDICTGSLPLGGATTKGYGCFTGTLERNNEIIYPNTNN